MAGPLQVTCPRCQSIILLQPFFTCHLPGQLHLYLDERVRYAREPNQPAICPSHRRWRTATSSASLGAVGRASRPRPMRETSLYHDPTASQWVVWMAHAAPLMEPRTKSTDCLPGSRREDATKTAMMQMRPASINKSSRLRDSRISAAQTRVKTLWV